MSTHCEWGGQGYENSPFSVLSQESCILTCNGPPCADSGCHVSRMQTGRIAARETVRSIGKHTDIILPPPFAIRDVIEPRLLLHANGKQNGGVQQPVGLCFANLAQSAFADNIPDPLRPRQTANHHRRKLMFGQSVFFPHQQALLLTAELSSSSRLRYYLLPNFPFSG